MISMKALKMILETSLSDNNYDKFLNQLNDLEIDKDNFWNVIAVVEEVIKDKCLTETIENKKDSKKVLLEEFGVIEKEHNFFDDLEDFKITWVDDIPVINTLISKQIKAIRSFEDSIELPQVFKDLDDKEFVRNLFRKTVLNEVEFAKEFENKTPNWDKERIAELDTIILKMAICELLKFPSIPVKVTLNEYLEIAKEYSTPKSSIFINGILDNLVKDFQTSEKLKKSGRGLL